MDFKQHGLICLIINTLCVIGVHISYAELTIDVTNTTCGQAYDISEYDKITLKYEDDGNINVTSRRPSCVFTIFNYHSDKELCVKQIESDSWGFLTCATLFHFFAGYLPANHNGGFSCRDFQSTPLCTGHSTVYAVFRDDLTFIQSLLTVQIYWRDKIITTTRRVTTTTYYSEYNNSDETDYGVSTGIIVMIFIGAFVLCSVCIVACKIARENSNDRNAIQSPIQYTQQSVPQVSLQTSESAYAADAPSYESLFQQQPQQPPSDGGVTEWQVHPRVCGGQSPSQGRSESQPPHNNSPETGLASSSPSNNQPIPTAPPPSYADLGFPPSYSGNT